MNWWCLMLCYHTKWAVHSGSYSIWFGWEHFCVIEFFFRVFQFSFTKFFPILNREKRFYDLLVFGASKILDHFFPTFWFVPLEASKILWIYYCWTSLCKNEFPWRIFSCLFLRIPFIHSFFHLNAFGRLFKWFTKPSNNNRCQWIVTN